MKTFKQKIDDLIKERKAKYRKADGSIDVDEIKATFNREKETTDGYNGRQLLELMQNADDEKSDEMLIKLNTEEQTLIIANKGKKCKPFSINGIKSLLLANLSSKNSNDYIGNKGLGFRSIINWSNEITINSNGLDISFSQDIAADAFKNSGFKKTELPILAIPKLAKNTQKKWTTRILINYKNNFSDEIEKQIKQIKPEILLFLNHLKFIKVNIDGTEQDISKPEMTIKSKAGNFPNELLINNDKDTKYELKIAFNNELTNNGSEYLFSYFPTKINIDFPFIVHGTFELDSTRNQLTDNLKNKFIVKKLVDFIIETAKGLSEGSVSYKALSFLNYSHKNEVLDELGFYKEIDSAIEELEIYPCVNNEYRKKDKVVYSNNFANFIEANNFSKEIPCLLKSANDDEESFLDSLHLYDFNDCNKENLEKINKKIKDIDIRAEFIFCLVKNKYDEKLPVLTNDNNKIIGLNEDIYAPTTQDFSLPKYVHIEFINQDLYNKLQEKNEGDLRHKLENITNIKEYNKEEILRKVITSTNSEIEKEDAKITTLIKSMLKCLHGNYSNSITISDQKIQLLDKEKKPRDAKDLYLSKTYPSGELTEELFGDIFTDSEFLANIKVFGLDGDKQQIEDFFLWLGVNKYTKLISKKQKNMRTTPHGYKEVTADFMSIDRFDEIKELPIVNIITCLILNKKIEGMQEVMGKYSHYGIQYIDIKNDIFNQLNELFANYLISKNNKINNLVNNENIDYGHLLFKDNNINKRDIDSLLLKIGAVENFFELDFEKVQTVLKTLLKKDSKGKYAQKIYIESFKFKDESLDADIKLFAEKGKEKKYFDQNKIYYRGIIKLPKEYTETKAIFDYPINKNTVDIVDFFNIKDLAEINIIITSNEKSNTNQEFLKYFEKIKPYILAYRLENIENKQEDESKKLQQIQMELCSNVGCEIENKKYQLSDYDYLIDKEKYIIKVPDKTLKTIRKSYDFYTTFGNILGLIFDVVNVEKFKNCLKDSNGDIERDIYDNISNHAVDEAKELLGINTDFHNFWQIIYKLKKLKYTDKHNDNLTLINKKLKINIAEKAINYKDLSENSDKLIGLFEFLKIDVIRFNKLHNDDGVDFSTYHQSKLQNCFDDNINKFKQCLHKYCKEKQKQSEYLGKLVEYEVPQNNNYKTDLLVKYQQKCVNFVEEKYGFELSKIKSDIDIDSIYEENKKQIGDDFEIIENNNDIRSLLYFDGLIEEVKTRITKEKKSIKRPKEQLKQNTITEITPAKLETPSSQTASNNSVNNRISYSQQNRQKAKAGEKAEQKVFAFLQSKYGKENVIWVAQEKPNADHDFKYKDKEKWWHVEVKVLSNNVFYISKNEKEFAEKNKDDYKIFLVDDSDIIKIYPVDFNDDKLKVEAENFSVRYQLTN